MTNWRCWSLIAVIGWVAAMSASCAHVEGPGGSAPASSAAGTGSYRDKLPAETRDSLKYLDNLRPLDPCGFISDSAVSKIGSPVHFGNSRSLNECEVLFSPPAGPKGIRHIELQMGVAITVSEPGAHDVKIGDKTVRMGLEGSSQCMAFVDFDSKQAVSFEMDGDQSAQVCPDLIELMKASLPLFTQRPLRADSKKTVPTKLARMDPCAVLDVIGKGLDTIEVSDSRDAGNCDYYLGKRERDESRRQTISFQTAPLSMVTDYPTGNPIKVLGAPATEGGNPTYCKIVVGVGADQPFDVLNRSAERERWIDMVELVGHTNCDALRKTAAEVARLYQAAK